MQVRCADFLFNGGTTMRTGIQPGLVQFFQFFKTLVAIITATLAAGMVFINRHNAQIVKTSDL